MSVSIILASMNRFDLFSKCVQQIKETTQHLDVEIIAIIDCDKQSYDFATKNCNVTDFSLVRRGALNSWNIGLKYTKGDILMPMGDDQWCHPNWLDIALQAHTNQLRGYGMVAVNDLMLDGDKQVGTTVLYDREFCKSVLGGVVAYPMYKYYRVDNELNARAKKIDKYFWCKESVVEHLHSANGKRTEDVIDRERTEFWEHDEKLYYEREAAGFPNNFDRII